MTEEVGARPDPNMTQIFELTREGERGAMVEWADLLDSTAGVIRDSPDPIVRVGDMLVRRPNGFYEVFRSFNALATEKVEAATVTNGEYRRMEVLRVVSTMPRFTADGDKTTAALAQELDDWVQNGTVSQSNG